jgi:hypothetical protein
MRIAEFSSSFQVVFELRLCIFNPKPGTRPKGGSPKDKSEISNPKCDDSNKLPHEVKTIEALSGGGSK